MSGFTFVLRPLPLALWLLCLLCLCAYPYRAIAQLSEDAVSDIGGVPDALIPVIGVSVEEEYNDNIYLRPDNEQEDYITRINPSVAWARINPLWHFDISYSPSQIIYALNTERNELRHTALFAGGVTLVRNMAFIDITDTFTRVSLNSRRESTGISLFVGQTDRNQLVVNPYFRRNITRSTRLEAGYEYTNTQYEDPGAIDRESHGVFITFGRTLSGQLDSDVSYRFTREIIQGGGSTLTSSLQNYDRNEADLGIQYRYSRSIDLFARGGVTSIKFDDADPQDGMHWNASVSYRLSASGSCSYSYYQSYENSVQYGVLELKRHSLGVSYEHRVRLSSEFFATEDEYLEINRQDQSWGVTASVDVPMQRRLEFHLSGEWRNRDYEPEGENVRRSIASASVRWTASGYLNFEAGYRYAKDKSSIYDNSYERNAVYLRANAEF